MVFSNEWIISEDKIFSKKHNKVYNINYSMYSDLKDLFYKKEIKLSQDEIHFLYRKGILTDKHRIYNPFKVTTKLSDDFRLFIQVTNQCNLRCAHCYANSSMNMEQFYDKGKLLDIVQEAYKLGISRIDFTGGEVFTQKYFMNFLEALDFYPITYSIFTNLTLLSEIDIDRLANLQGLSRIITSVDYFDNKKHDEFRGIKGSYEKTLKNIFLLQSKKSTCCSEYNRKRR